MTISRLQFVLAPPHYQLLVGSCGRLCPRISSWRQPGGRSYLVAAADLVALADVRGGGGAPSIGASDESLWL